MLTFVKYLFDIYGDDYMIFLLNSVKLTNYSNEYTNIIVNILICTLALLE